MISFLRSFLLGILCFSCAVSDEDFASSLFGDWEAYPQGSEIHIHEGGAYEWNKFIFSSDYEADVYLEKGRWIFHDGLLELHPVKSSCQPEDRTFKLKFEDNDAFKIVDEENKSTEFSRTKFSFLAMESLKTTYHCSF